MKKVKNIPHRIVHALQNLCWFLHDSCRDTTHRHTQKHTFQAQQTHFASIAGYDLVFSGRRDAEIFILFHWKNHAMNACMKFEMDDRQWARHAHAK